MLNTIAMAVMPPAPPEWYTEHHKMPVPEGIRKGMPTIPPEIQRDLDEAALLRPNNTDNLLLILVEFSDNPADQGNHPQSAYIDLMFSTGVLPTGSLYEYYQEISYGAFAPAGTVTVWITAPHPYSYYADGHYGFGSYPNNSQGLLEDCVNLLDPFLDFSIFDNNFDGYAEGIFLVHAGPGAEETGDPNDIWSHAWYYEAWTNDGVTTGRYSTEPEELLGGEMIKIGVFCHEYGHVLGLPDLYDTDGSSEGIGVYCLMSGGSWGALPGNPERPTHMCAEMKRRLGWMTPVEVTGNLIDLVIPPAATNSVCYRISHPTDPDEYFLIENRAKIGYDSLFRGDGGLAIWHVDWIGWQLDETHRYVSLEQADGSSDLEKDYGTGNRHPRTNRGDAGDLYPGATANTHFSVSSNPNSKSNNSALDLITITGIEYYGDSIRLDLYVDPAAPVYRAVATEVLDTVSIGFPSNFNSDADSGEVVDLVIALACDGVGASALTGMLTITDPRVSVLDNSADFGIAAHGQALFNESSPFRFEVLSGRPAMLVEPDSAVTFLLQLDSDGQLQDIEIKLNINRQRIMLVLDNNGSHWSENLVAAMQNVGYSFDTYLTSENGTPDYDDLIPYHAVIWTTGSYFGTRTSGPNYESCLTQAETDVLAEYLDNAGRVGLFSQDYIYDNGIDQFLSDYMHVATVDQDQSVDHLIGEPDSYMDGFEGWTKEWHFYDYTDHITPGADARATLNDMDGPGHVAVSYPYWLTEKGFPATTYSAFSIERLDAIWLEQFMDFWISWILNDLNLDVPLPIAPKNDDVVNTLTPELSWTLSEGALVYHYEVATDFDFSNIVLQGMQFSISSVETDSLPEGSYFWRVAAEGSDGPFFQTAFSPRAAFSIELAYVPGDADGSGFVDIDDAVYLINYIFGGGPAPDPLVSGDADCSGNVDIDDVVYLINYIFGGGPAPLDC
jgi:immune inhibitor A